jgi:hypothetical protein
VVFTTNVSPLQNSIFAVPNVAKQINTENRLFRGKRKKTTKTMRKALHLFGRAFRETGQALDRFGLKYAEQDIYKETFSRHRPVMNLFDKVKLR